MQLEVDGPTDVRRWSHRCLSLCSSRSIVVQTCTDIRTYAAPSRSSYRKLYVCSSRSWSHSYLYRHLWDHPLGAAQTSVGPSTSSFVTRLSVQVKLQVDNHTESVHMKLEVDGHTDFCSHAARGRWSQRCRELDAYKL